MALTLIGFGQMRREIWSTRVYHLTLSFSFFAYNSKCQMSGLLMISKVVGNDSSHCLYRRTYDNLPQLLN